MLLSYTFNFRVFHLLLRVGCFSQPNEIERTLEGTQRNKESRVEHRSAELNNANFINEFLWKFPSQLQVAHTHKHKVHFCLIKLILKLRVSFRIKGFKLRWFSHDENCIQNTRCNEDNQFMQTRFWTSSQIKLLNFQNFLSNSEMNILQQQKVSHTRWKTMKNRRGFLRATLERFSSSPLKLCFCAMKACNFPALSWWMKVDR